ncbi:MAG: hypothetical protein OEQ81_12745 [Flavobacteriaceae bacterium]|nr:hypothetical protein [Flavobacteriaceae bacterium]
MFRFFRKIRRQLLTDNKFSKYLLYVIVEIFIVIIGILIAIQLNNCNEERIGAENTKLLFQEVSDELVQNIKNIDRKLDIYILKDSLYFKVLIKRVEYEDYKESPSLFNFALTTDGWGIVDPLTYEWTSLVDDDFKELLARKDNLTEPQDSIFSELKDLYGKRKIDIDINDKTIYDTHLNFRDKLINELPWWSDYVTNSFVTDEMIQYALDDPFYLNQLSELRFREFSHATGMLWFRTKALNLHKNIADMLNIEKDTTLVKDIADFEHVKGMYEWSGARFDIRGKNELKSSFWSNDSLVVQEADIYPYYNSHLIIHTKEKGETWLAKIEFGKDGEVLGLTWFGFMEEEDENKIISKKIE